MKAAQEKQPEQERVSSLGESPKDENQNTYTEEETSLAAKYKVEPKLVRLLNEIAEEHFAEQAEPEEVEGTETEGPETDEESEFQKKRFQNCVADIQKIVSFYPVECRPKLLVAALEQATKGKGAAEKIVEIGQEIHRTCDSLLDPKAKATLALLSELSSLSGITNVGVDFATDILHSAYGPKHIKQALEQFPDDSDVAFLSYVFGLAHSVTGAEGKLFQQETAAEEETTIEQPQADEPDDTDTEKQPKRATPITILQNWLSKRKYPEKLTAVLLWQLINKEDVYKKEGYCEGSIGNELFREYEQTVVDASQDKEYLTKADPEEVSVTGLVTGLLPMRV